MLFSTGEGLGKYLRANLGQGGAKGMKQSFDKGQAVGLVCALASSLLFGFSFLANRVGVSEISPFSLLGWRLSMAFISMHICVVLGLFKVDFRGKPLMPLLLMGLTNPILNFTGELLGLKLTSASEGGAILSCIPIVTLLFMPLISREYPTRRQWASIILSVAGVIIIGAAKMAGPTFNIMGYVFLLGAALSGGLFLNLCRRFTQYTEVERIYAITAIGAVFFSAAALVENGLRGTLQEYLLLPIQKPGLFAGILYLAVGCSAAGFTLQNIAVTRLGLGRTGSFTALSNLIGVMSGVIFLKEGFSLLQGVGTVLVLLGVYGANSLPLHARRAVSVPSTLSSEEEK